MEARTYAHTHIVPGRIQGSPWQKQDAGRAAYGVPWRPSSGGRGTGRVSTWVPGPGALLPRCPADAALPPHHSTAPPPRPGRPAAPGRHARPARRAAAGDGAGPHRHRRAAGRLPAQRRRRSPAPPRSSPPPRPRPASRSVRALLCGLPLTGACRVDADLTFPPGLSNHDRAVVHSECKKYGFTSKSHGCAPASLCGERTLWRRGWRGDRGRVGCVQERQRAGGDCLQTQELRPERVGCVRLALQ